MATTSPLNHVPPTQHSIQLRQSFVDRLRFARSKNPSTATTFDRFVALSLAVRD